MPEPATPKPAMNTPPARDDHALSISRVFDAPRSLVFKVWSSPEHLARWWGPKNFSVPSVTVDFRRNGKWRSCIRSPEGNDYWASGSYREIVTPSLLVLTFRWEEDGAIDTLVTVAFEDAGAGTRVTFQQAPFLTADERDSHADGWGECLDRLGRYLSEQDGSNP